MNNRRSRHIDVVLGAAAWTAAAVLSLTFGLIVWDVVSKGLPSLSIAFLFDAPADAGRAGGVGPVIVSTLLVLAVCFVVALPIGVGAAAYLAEFSRQGGLLTKVVRQCLDTLAAVPSIVFGLFGMVLFCQILGMGYSIAAGGLTLACMVLPVIVRTTESGLRSTPESIRQAAAALGLSRLTTLRRLLLPAAAQGIIVGVVLGIARAMAETAALIFTAGYVSRMPSSLFDSGRTLSVHIYDLAMNVPGGEERAYASALVLLAILCIAYLLAIELSRRWLAGGAKS